MSGLAAVFNRDGSPVDPVILDRLLEAIAHRGRDGRGVWNGGPIALGHQAFATTPEARLERPPLSSERAGIRLIYDGRLDNTDELRRELFANSARHFAIGDGELLLRAYECWGDDFARHLIGDFAVVIWDERRQECVCVRDAIGLKPLYYYLDDRRFVCGSELGQVLAHPAVPVRPNEGMIGEYLACAVTATDETVYRDVHRLPAAHLMHVGREYVGRRRYWDIDSGRRERLGSDVEYAAALRTLLEHVITAQGRTNGSVGCELSGGVDSSAITAVAADRARHGSIGAIEAFSLTFAGRSCDESEYIDQVVRHCGVQSHRVPAATLSVDQWAREVDANRELPDYPNAVAWYPLMDAARRRGCDVVLTGVGGDDWFMGSFFHYADMLRQLRLRALWKQMAADRAFAVEGETAAVSFPANALWHLAIFPLVPMPARAIARRLLGRRGVPSWISPAFGALTSLADRIRVRHDRRWHNRGQQHIYSSLTNGWFADGNETADRVQSRHGIERRSPLLDRRIVEFGLALPEEQRWRGAETKVVLRNAVKGLLPEPVRQRRTKANFGQLCADLTSHMVTQRACVPATLAALGWIDVTRVEAMLSNPRAHAWQLWMMLSIDRWYRKAFTSGDDGRLVQEEMCATMSATAV
jgi:asparagine synthase (glutamine-hydrolysing)